MATNQKSNPGNDRQSNQNSRNNSNNRNSEKGFGNMSDEKQREAASKGGRNSQSGSNSNSKH